MSLSSSEPANGAAVCCRHVTKRFLFYERRTDSMRELFIRTLRGQSAEFRRPYFALVDFDLTVRPGESVALIGRNGSGKSTALRLIAGIYPPSEGSVTREGRVAAVMELGAGLQQELSGRDNITLYGTIMGQTRKEVAARLEAIVEFAEIEEFIDVPLKYYSSGMRARLAFAVAFASEPDVLLLDEVFAVGDQGFRQRCMKRLREYRAGGGTMILVSHSMDLVREMCSRAVWLDKGESVMSGGAEEVVKAYQDVSRPRALPRS